MLTSTWVGEQPPNADYVHKTAGLLTDPPHATSELIYSAIENIVVLTVGYWLAKRRIRKEHVRIDREHGHRHEEDTPL